ncbi:MAG: Crp/Fnr family transcriptional regulator [Deltaproteobacteria bacterium]|nr:Crp/Fnr family transcriptional regulator [Deltaproteobacteria bacterium]
MSEISPAERDRLLEHFGRRYNNGEVIFREGDPSREVFMLQEGRVRVMKRVRTVERSIQILKPGDLFGESALLSGVQRASTAIALSDVVVLALDPDTFNTLLQGSGAVATRLVQQLVRRLRDAEDQIENMLLKDHQSKVVNALLRLASETGRVTGSAQVAVSPLELSARSGLDVDTVKRTVLQLREGQYIRIVEEKVAIDDLDALRRLFTLLGMKEQVRG